MIMWLIKHASLLEFAALLKLQFCFEIRELYLREINNIVNMVYMLDVICVAYGNGALLYSVGSIG